MIGDDILLSLAPPAYLEERNPITLIASTEGGD